MYDPMTVAFDIKYPWFRRGAWPHRWTFLPASWRSDRHWKDGYRETAITIWHVDPVHDAHEKGLRGDDSCGWFTPPTTPAEREAVAKLGRQQYSTLFSRRHYIQRGESFAQMGNEPSPYDAVYWAWRAIKYQGRSGWMYGDRKPGLSRREEEAVRLLATNPVDNVQHTVERVLSEEACAEFFGIVHRAFVRHHRPRWKHPRWHVHHWRIQINVVGSLKRWLFTRCCRCGNGFAWGAAVHTDSWHGTGPRWFRSEANVYHADCRASHPRGISNG